MSYYSQCVCIVCGNVRMHCTCAMGPCNHSGARNRIAALEAERDEARRTCDTLRDLLETAQEERDEARARCERLREAGKAMRRLEPNFLSHMDEYRAAQKLFDAALAGCEVKGGEK